MRHSVGTETGRALWATGEVSPLSRCRYPIIALRPPKTRGRRKVYPGSRAPAANPRTHGAELTRARDPEWVRGAGPGGGSRSSALHLSFPPGRGRGGCRRVVAEAGRGAAGARGAGGERRRAGAGLTVRSSWVRSFMLPGVATAPAAAL